MTDLPSFKNSVRPAPAVATQAVGTLEGRWPAPLFSLGLAALYLGLEWLSFLHEHGGLPVTPWNPGLGLMFAVIILKGTTYGVVFFASVLLSAVLVLGSALGWASLIVVAATTAIAYTGVAGVVRDLLRLSTPHFHTRDMGVVIVGGLAGAVIASTILGFGNLMIRQVNWIDALRTAGLSVLGDVIGIAVVTPLVLRAYRHREKLKSVPPEVLFEFSGYLGVILIALGIIMRPDQPFGQGLFYLLFLPVVVAAVRHGIDGACAALTIAQLGLVGILHLYGFDLARFTEYQLLMLVMTVTVLLVGAVVSERDAADEAARDAARRLQVMQNEAARTARLNLVSGMAAALAHEINQPMTAARAHARSVSRLLESENGDKARAVRNVQSMIEQIDHAAAVVRRMREFLRRGEPDTEVVDAQEAVADALALVQPLASSEGITIIAPRGPISLPHVIGDPVQIQQVIINLVRNGIDAIRESGRTDGRIAIEFGFDDTSVEIAISDNGIGIAPDRVDTIFEPLSTTKIDGLGLGLSICKMIVQAHGGRIRVSETSSQGTEVRFSLPSTSRKVSGRT